MRLNPFKKDPVKKAAKEEKDTIYDTVKAQISKELGEVEKITDRKERIVRYEALDKKLQGVYSDGKPGAMESAGPGAAAGGFRGFAVGMIAGGVTIVAVPLLSLPALLGIWGISTAAGATGGAGIGGLHDKDRRKLLRAKYGSVRNAQAIYKLQKTIAKNLEKDKEAVRLRDLKEKETASLREHEAKLREEFNKNFKNEETPAATPPAPLGGVRLIRRDAPAEDAPVSTAKGNLKVVMPRRPRQTIKIKLQN